MIVSKYSKTYDTADGSEQRSHEARVRPAVGDGRASGERWDDDGGRPSPPPGAMAPSPGELTSKPAWSVLSLADLNRAVRAATDPARLRAEEAGRLEVERGRVNDARDARLAAATRAERDRDRNAWEHA